MKVCFDCKVAVLNGCYCPYCHQPFQDYNDSYIETIMEREKGWEYEIHECTIRDDLEE